MMGIEQLDFLDESADTMISLLDADQKEEAKALIQQLRGLITEEKKKVFGEGLFLQNTFLQTLKMFNTY